MLQVTRYTILFVLFLLLVECVSQSNKNTSNSTNRLISESSPYLLQHAHNPVDWYPWGNEAMEKAKRENKLLLISIGYSACHWCHVMEHQSFEDTAIAKIMNDHFVCIKVDREERPDVDKIYMEAVQLLSGQGGWPLNCFALPNGKPVWGGTYFPKEKWQEILTSMHQLYLQEPRKIRDQATQLTNGIRQNKFINFKSSSAEIDLSRAIATAQKVFDNENGGFGQTTKFPMPVALAWLHEHAYLNGDESVFDFFYGTLDKMASGGIYDQVGGGFSRYSVDKRWFAPHFEKMLYDNAQLISLYSKAYKTSQKKLYKRIVDESILFIKREMSAPEGNFYSSLDADSEGEEGKFYTFTKAELKPIIGNDTTFFKYFGITDKGNWEHSRSILHNKITRERYALQNNLDSTEFKRHIKKSLLKVFNYRSKRIRPGLDNKILTAWNGLMITGLIDAYEAFGDEEYLNMAEKCIEALNTYALSKNGHVIRTTRNNNEKVDGFLDDYAFITEALIRLHEVTFKKSYLTKAQTIADYAVVHFYDKNDSLFYYTSDQTDQLIARKTDIHDNVIPSSVGTMAKNLIKLSQFNTNNKYEEITHFLIEKMKGQIVQFPIYNAQWASLYSLNRGHLKEIVICGHDALKYKKQLQKHFIPGTIYTGSVISDTSIDLLKNRFMDGQTLIYRCTNKHCELPFNNPDDFFGKK